MTTPSPAPSQASQASAANGEALPGWPVAGAWYRHGADRQLAEAWESRCRLAVEYIERLVEAHDAYCEHHVGVSKHSYDLYNIGRDALEAVGPLPSPKEQRT